MVKKPVLILASLVVALAAGYGIIRVFSGNWILPQDFYLGPLKIRYYGLCMALAVLAGYLLARSRAQTFGLALTQADDIVFWSIVGGFIGARLYHVASSFPYYVQQPVDILKVWNGGLSIYGALIGGFIAVVVCIKVLRIPFSILRVADWLTPSLLLGQIIGRFGNFFNYELYGYPTQLVWKMFVPSQFRYNGFEQFSFFHPLFLYEAVINAIFLFFLLKLEKKKKIFTVPGALFFSYVFLYNIARFCLEFLRIDSTIYHTIRINAVVSAVLVCASLAAFIVIRKAHDQIS